MLRVELLVLRAGDEKVLKGWLRSSTVSAGLAQRARILLLAAEGHSNTEIGRRVGVSLPTVRLWRSRYATGGLAQLDDQPRSGRPAVHDEQVIIAATLEPPPEKLGVTHWSPCDRQQLAPRNGKPHEVVSGGATLRSVRHSTRRASHHRRRGNS